MFKLFLNYLKKDYILSRKIMLVVLIFIVISFGIQTFIEQDTSIESYFKGLIISLMIFNISTVILAFKTEEESEFKYIEHLLSLKYQYRIVSRYIYFMLINILILFSYIITDISFLMYGYLLNILICSIILLVFYVFGSEYIPVILLIISFVSIFINNIIKIDFSLLNNINTIVFVSFIIYITSLFLTIILVKLKNGDKRYEENLH